MTTCDESPYFSHEAHFTKWHNTSYTDLLSHLVMPLCTWHRQTTMHYCTQACACTHALESEEISSLIHRSLVCVCVTVSAKENTDGKPGIIQTHTHTQSNSWTADSGYLIKNNRACLEGWHDWFTNCARWYFQHDGRCPTGTTLHASSPLNCLLICEWLRL